MICKALKRKRISAITAKAVIIYKFHSFGSFMTLDLEIRSCQVRRIGSIYIANQAITPNTKSPCPMCFKVTEAKCSAMVMNNKHGNHGNPAATQRQIQALTAQLLNMTTSKSGATTRARVPKRAQSREATNPPSRAS